MALSDLSVKLASNSRFWVFLAVASLATVALFQLFRVDNPLTIQEMIPDELPLVSAANTTVLGDITTITDSLIAGGIPIDSLAITVPLSGDSLALSRHYFREGIQHYNARSYSESVSFFGLSTRFIPAGTSPDERQLWFAALAQAQNGNLEAALLLAVQVYQLTGDYRSEAFVLAKKILFETGLTIQELQNLQPSSL